MADLLMHLITYNHSMVVMLMMMQSNQLTFQYCMHTNEALYHDHES
jgi:hypothetical protein